MTSLLSDGPDKLSKLDIFIVISISSARLTANPDALKLLRFVNRTVPCNLHTLH
jgi:hypothetical protein